MNINGYPTASLAHESLGLKMDPVSLQLEEDECVQTERSISRRQLHNYFYDGFYAPYMTNPEYMLLLDVRHYDCYLQRHILSSRWYGHVPVNDELDKYIFIVLYDDDGSSLIETNSNLNQLKDQLTSRRLEFYIIDGGISAVDQCLPYMVTDAFLSKIGLSERHLSCSWYPSIIIENTLWLGRIEQGSSTDVLFNLNLTHMLHIGQSRPALALPGMTCLTIHWKDTLKGWCSS